MFIYLLSLGLSAFSNKNPCFPTGMAKVTPGLCMWDNFNLTGIQQVEEGWSIYMPTI